MNKREKEIFDAIISQLEKKFDEFINSFDPSEWEAELIKMQNEDCIEKTDEDNIETENVC